MYISDAAALIKKKKQSEKRNKNQNTCLRNEPISKKRINARAASEESEMLEKRAVNQQVHFKICFASEKKKQQLQQTGFYLLLKSNLVKTLC